MGFHRSSSRDGYERARQHIREAEELSRELGGTDKDVKEYFFSLDGKQLYPILTEYEREYGLKARNYAVETIPAWKSGRRKMAGQTAARLFKMLPKYMPLDRKYSLIENLWNQHAPRSEFSIEFSPDVVSSRVEEVLSAHLSNTVNSHTIPEPLQKRFQWLAAGDSVLYQQLLNHFLMRDRDFAVEAVGAQVNVLLQQYPHAIGRIQAFNRDIKVGGHIVHVVLDPKALSVSLHAGKPHRTSPASVLTSERRQTSAPLVITSKSNDDSYKWVAAIVIAVVLLILWALSQK